MSGERRIWMSVTAATIVVGVVVVIAQGGEDGPPNGSSTETFTCRAGDQVAATEWDGNEVPAGAVGVRLCQGNSVAGGRFVDPLDELTADVDSLVTLINEQPIPEPSNGCNGDGGIGYTMLFRYPDDTQLAVAGEMYGCRLLSVGGDDKLRLGPETVWDEFLRLLRVQRAQATPPSALPDRARAAVCGEDLATPLSDASEMASAVLCLRNEGEHAVSAADLAVLMDDRRTARGDRSPTRRECDGQTPRLELTGITAWGDPVVMTQECGVFASWSTDRNAGSPIWWRPNARSQAILDRLVAEIRSDGRP